MVKTLDKVATLDQVNTIIASDINLQGDYDASANSPDLDTAPAGISKGWHYVVSVAGTFFTEALEVGDSIIAKDDNPTVLTDWILIQVNLTAPSVKTLYESNANTNEYDDAEQTKLAGIETAATAEQYKDGWLVNQDGTGEGRIYRIEGHEAQTSTTGTLEVFLAERIDIAMAISETNVDLTYNKYDELRPQDSTTQTFIPVGVPMMVGGLGASEFGYIQTWGPCAVWQDEATANLGEQLTFGAGTGTGQLEGRDAVTEPLFAVSGPAASVADEYQLVYITISR